MDRSGLRWPGFGSHGVCLCPVGHGVLFQGRCRRRTQGLFRSRLEHGRGDCLDVRAVLWPSLRIPVHLEAPQQRHAHALRLERVLGWSRRWIPALDVLAQRAGAFHPQAGRRLATRGHDGHWRHRGVPLGHALGDLLRRFSTRPRPLLAHPRGAFQHWTALDRQARLPFYSSSVC